MEEKLIKRQKQKRFLSFFIIFIILSITVVISLKSDYFKIKEVEVKNNNLISRDETIILANVIGENIFFLNKDRVKTNILNNPYVKDVKINKKLPSKVILTIQEKDIKGIIRLKNYFVDIDSEGRMVHTINKFPNGKLIYIEGIDAKEYVFNEYVTSDAIKLRSIVEVLKIFAYSDIKSQIEKVDVKDPYNVNIVTKSGINICIGDCSNLEYKLSFAMTLLKSPELNGKKGTIDISSDGTAVFCEKRGD